MYGVIVTRPFMSMSSTASWTVVAVGPTAVVSMEVRGKTSGGLECKARWWPWIDCMTNWGGSKDFRFEKRLREDCFWPFIAFTLDTSFVEVRIVLDWEEWDTWVETMLNTDWADTLSTPDRPAGRGGGKKGWLQLVIGGLTELQKELKVDWPSTVEVS